MAGYGCSWFCVILAGFCWLLLVVYFITNGMSFHVDFRHCISDTWKRFHSQEIFQETDVLKICKIPRKIALLESFFSSHFD